MKPLAHWQEKTLLAKKELERVRLLLLKVETGYRMRRSARRIRRIFASLDLDVGAHVRRRNAMYMRRKAKLTRRLEALSLRIAYFNERIAAIQEQSRFDRVRRSPPL